MIGSTGIFWFLHNTYRQRSTTEFQQLAQSNAQFIASIHLPTNDRFAAYLSRVLDMDVLFVRQSSSEPVPGPHQELARANIEPGLDLVLIRGTTSLTGVVFRPASIAVLSGFWILSFALAAAIARNVVQPFIETRKQLAAAERLAMLGKMTASLAHEIQNPVAAIRLHAQLLENTSAANLAPTAASTIPIVLTETDRIENLVNQWLFIARPQPPQTSPANLTDTIEKTIESLQPLARHARVEIQSNLVNHLVVQADSKRLRQAFGNIITNAIQAMTDGGALRITGSRVASDITIEFHDTGPGFSASALKRCPELFYSEKEGGMGIGLAVAAEIIRAHHGRLTIANAPTGGAQVRIRLPAAASST